MSSSSYDDSHPEYGFTSFSPNTHVEESASKPPLHAAGLRLDDYMDTSSRINRLPTELLSAIFNKATSHRPYRPILIAPDRSTKRAEFNIQPVITLALVCRLWRNVVIGDASLWSYIDADHSSRRSLWISLHRSSGYPLTLRIGLGRNQLADTVLANHGNRIRSLHAADSGSRLPLKSILRRFHFHAPQIESFTLVQSYDAVNESSEGLIFAEETSPLKALALMLPHAFLPTNSFPNLSHLFLQFATQEPASRILQLLFNTPILEHFQLSCARSIDVVRTQTPPERRIPLNHLRSAVFMGGLLEVHFDLLSGIKVPADILLCFSHSGTSCSLNDSPPSLRIPKISLLDTLTFMELSLQQEYLLVTGYDTQMTSGFIIDTEHFCDASLWIAHLHTMLPLSRITILNININDVVTMDCTFRPILRHFVRLEELHALFTPDYFEPESSPLLVKLLCTALTPTHRDPQVLPCPELRVFGIEADLAHDEFPFPALETMAAAHRRAGHGLSRLTYQLHTIKFEHDAEEMCQRFSASLSPLTAFVHLVEFRCYPEEEKLCSFKPRECWELREAEKYWVVPRKPRYSSPWGWH